MWIEKSLNLDLLWQEGRDRICKAPLYHTCMNIQMHFEVQYDAPVKCKWLKMDWIFKHWYQSMEK